MLANNKIIKIQGKKIVLFIQTKIHLHKQDLKWIKATIPVLEAFLKNKKKGWALSAKVECSLLLCGMKQMQKLNKLHRKKDKVTDVISFPCYESFESSSLKKVKDLCLGDIVICVPQAKKQAPQFGIAWQVEMIYLFTHGFLHLCGWDHERSLKEEKKMNEWEAKLVSAILSKCHKEYL